MSCRPTRRSKILVERVVLYLRTEKHGSCCCRSPEARPCTRKADPSNRMITVESTEVARITVDCMLQYQYPSQAHSRHTSIDCEGTYQRTHCILHPSLRRHLAPCPSKRYLLPI